MPRIAFGGFQHETNTFSPVKATFADFEAADAWPGLTQGDAIFDCSRRDQPADRGLRPGGAEPAPRAGAAALVPGAAVGARDARRLRARERADGRGNPHGRRTRRDLSRPARRDGRGTCRRRRRRAAASHPPARRPAAADRREPGLSCQRLAPHGGGGKRTGVVPHLPARRHGRHRRAGRALPARSDRPTPPGACARADRLPDAAHLAVDAGRADALTHGRGNGARARPAPGGRADRRLPGVRRRRMRTGGLCLRPRRHGYAPRSPRGSRTGYALASTSSCSRSIPSTMRSPLPAA